MYILGFDIGGTKCAVVTALWNGKTINISKKKSIPTDHGVSTVNAATVAKAIGLETVALT